MRFSNRYNVLCRLPRYDAPLAGDGERLARQMVASGLLRINADSARNFALYSGPAFDRSFSWRELTDPALWPATEATLRDLLPGMAGEDELYALREQLKRGCKSQSSISPQRELELARLLVQAAHPAVVELALREGVAIYVSYSHEVADLMAMHFWESRGHSGGLQSISGDGAAVYVSCGGNPFITDDAHKTFVSDGFGALARLMVIAAQEFGHYADLLRHASGRVVSRHSASLMPLRAKAAYGEARRKDMERVAALEAHFSRTPLADLAACEKRLAFYVQHRPYSLARAVCGLRVWTQRQQLRRRAEARSLLRLFPERLEGGDGFAQNVLACLADMAFNLAPMADAYRRDDAAEEEAIATIEALARVPQQVMKWGHDATRYCWPELCRLYYGEVIPANIAALERLRG